MKEQQNKMIQVLDHYSNDIYNIAPAEGKIQYECFKKMEMKQSLFHIYSQMEKNTWTESRGKRIPLAKYFNNRLMNANGRFAKDIDYIFFSQYLSELKQVID